MKAAVVGTTLGGDVFERARRAGFAGVELSVGRDEPTAGDELAVPSLILSEHNEGGIASADTSVAAAAAEDVRRAVGWAAQLGADVILVPFFLRAELRSEADVERCAAAFRELCPVAAEGGVTLCYEGTLPADRVLALAEAVSSPAFGVYFDLANPLVEGLDPATELRKLAPLVRRVHVKDTLVRRGDCRLGLGVVDFAECARALEEIGYDGWLVVEAEPEPWELAARDLSFMRHAFPGLDVDQEWPRFGAFSHDLPADAERLGETFARLGLNAVQLAGPLLDECLADFSRAGATADVLAEHGVTVTGLGAYGNVIAPDREARRLAFDRLGRCLELAPLLGTSVVATAGGSRNPAGDWNDTPDNRSDKTRRLVAEALQSLRPVAEANGSLLALEAHVNTALKSPAHLHGLLDGLASEQLQLVCDPYNVVSRRLLPAHERLTRDFLDRFENRFVLAHLKDVSPEGAEAGTPAFGTGAFAQRPYLEFLRDRRPDLPLILEHLPLEEIPAAIDRVRMTLSAPGRRYALDRQARAEQVKDAGSARIE